MKTRTSRAIATIAAAWAMTGCSDDGIVPDQSGTSANGSSSGLTSPPTTSGGSLPTGAGTTSMDSSPGGSTADGTGPATTGMEDATTTLGSTGAGSSSSGGSSSSSEGGSSSSSDGGESSSGGPMCQSVGMSCAMGEACCAGLMCCAGVPVPPGAEYCDAMCPISDYRRKRDFEAVDVDAVLDEVAALAITTWSYRHEDRAVRHIGPMAQDFQARFDVGASDESIFVVDADGVSLAAIQALYARLRAAEARNVELSETVDALERRLDALEAR